LFWLLIFFSIAYANLWITSIYKSVSWYYVDTMKNIYNKNAGFTLIELLVVIAIIGLLSSVILGSLNSVILGSLNNARARAANASVRSNLASIRAQAELIYDGTPGYAGICSNATINNFRNTAATAGGGTNVCNTGGGASQTSYAISVQLKVTENGFNFWCVDNTGASRGHVNALGAASVCP